MPAIDPVHDLLRRPANPLEKIFHPKTVAVIGASEKLGSVGRSALFNLLNSPFGGAVYPVSLNRKNVLGVQAYTSINLVPEKVDLALIATPAATVPTVIQQCIEAQVPAAVILSAGFKESGADGQALERELKTISSGKIRIIGPNCLGVMNPVSGLNASFAQTVAKPGRVAFLSQSGALCTAILDWSEQEKVGFSAFVSVGSMIDVDWGDLIDYFGSDPGTRSIVIYMESITNARSFLSAARATALTKPIIVIKAGRSEAAAKAAASHTGALAGNDAVLEAAFQRVGVLRVERISEVFHLADMLSKQSLPKGPNLGIVTNAGGPGVLAVDALFRGEHGALGTLSPESITALNLFLPKHWSHANPVDIIGDADAERYAKTFEIVAKDPALDGLLLIMTPQGVTHPTEIAGRIAPLTAKSEKPVLASWMGGGGVSTGNSILAETGVATFPFPDDAVRAFGAIWASQCNIRNLYETPARREADLAETERSAVSRRLEEIRKSGRTLLSEYESKQVLSSYLIPTVPTCLAATPEEAVAAAQMLGFPVAVKINSFSVTHKSDVGGVRLNLANDKEVRDAYSAIQSAVTKAAGADAFSGVTVQTMVKRDGIELILGSSIDAQFGPVILFGLGGKLVEIFKDSALSLPPLNSTLARRLMERTRIFKALAGVRGRAPVDIAQLERVIVRFSDLVLDQPAIAEIDINPLLASGSDLVALDARILLHPSHLSAAQLPQPAIRPYPTQYCGSGKMKDGTEVRLRPIRPEDEPRIVSFHENLSEQTVESRYMHSFQLSERTKHDRLIKTCHIDYDREIALVCERGSDIIAVGRIIKLPGSLEAELSLVVEDRFQNQGVGKELVSRLVRISQEEKIRCIRASLRPDNLPMKAIFSRLGFTQKILSNCIEVEKCL